MAGLEPLLNPCVRLDAGIHPGMDLEMGSSLDDEYSVTHVATEVAWYSPCVMWSRGGANGTNDGGRLEWVVCWVCGRGFVGIGF